MTAIKRTAKVIAAAAVSVAVLCGLLCFYDILPVHIQNPKGNTDYVWPANSIWVKATEGISFGRFDANGYNNIEVVENPDILVLGSSHMEATFVMQDENAAYLLSRKLNGAYSVYNMGISDHNFFKVCQYLPANLELYDAVPKAVVVETSTVDVTQKDAEEAVLSSVEYTPSHNGGWIGTLQRIPFVRALYHQMQRGLLDRFLSKPASAAIEAAADAQAPASSTSSEGGAGDDAYETLFAYLEDLEKKYGTQIIIFYHPRETLLADGGIAFPADECLDAFDRYARKHGITFVDMTSGFEKMYYIDHHVAHGFCTGELATGHLNKYGHAAIADEVYAAIVRLEEAGELCR